MKKTIAAACLMTALIVPVSISADPAITFETNVKHADNLYDSANLRLDGMDGRALGALDGTALTDYEYSSFSCDKSGYTVAYKNSDDLNCAGIMNLTGELIAPCEYAEIKIQDASWALAYILSEATADNYDFESWGSDNFYLIETVDVYRLKDGTAEKKGSFTRDQFLDFGIEGSLINIQDRTTSKITTYDGDFNVIAEDEKYTSSYPKDALPYAYNTFSENGQTGVKDQDGNVVMAPAYKYIDRICKGYCVVNTGDAYGLTTIDGTVVAEPEYETIYYNYWGSVDEPYTDDTYSLVSHGYFAFGKDGKVGFGDLTGAVTCEPKFTKDLLTINGCSAVYTDLESVTHILAADGIDTPVPDYAHVDVLQYSDGMLYSVKDSDYNCGLIDWHGNVILPVGSGSSYLTPDGKNLLVEPDYDSIDVYSVDYGAAPAAPAVESEVTEIEEASEEAPTEGSPVKSLIESAISLANADLGGNLSAVVELVKNAASEMSSNISVSTLLNSAVSMLEGDAPAAEAVVSLLNSVLALL